MDNDYLVNCIDEDNHKFCIRFVSSRDQELLRCWKNKYSTYFFFSQQISITNQSEWFEGYKTRPNDHLFMIEFNSTPIGCIGLRLQDNHWDIYNVIRGHYCNSSRGIMSLALKSIISFARSCFTLPIRLKVLIGNPAYRWYLKNNFYVLDTYKDYVVMQYRF